MTAFATLQREYRTACSLTQEELAERAGLTAKAVGLLERGVRRRPYPHTVRALADALLPGVMTSRSPAPFPARRRPLIPLVAPSCGRADGRAVAVRDNIMVLVDEVADGGWGIRGEVLTLAKLQQG